MYGHKTFVSFLSAFCVRNMPHCNAEVVKRHSCAFAASIHFDGKVVGCRHYIVCTPSPWSNPIFSSSDCQVGTQRRQTIPLVWPQFRRVCVWSAALPLGTGRPFRQWARAEQWEVSHLSADQVVPIWTEHSHYYHSTIVQVSLPQRQRQTCGTTMWFKMHWDACLYSGYLCPGVEELLIVNTRWLFFFLDNVQITTKWWCHVNTSLEISR